MPKLIIEFQSQEWAVDLKEGSNLVGRSSGCSIPIRDANLSREHCEFTLAGAVATVVDKGSKNGTAVNGKRVQEHRLQSGDRIAIGQVVIWFEVKNGGRTPAPASEPRPAAATVDTQAGTRRAAGPRSESLRAAAAALRDFSLAGSAPRPWGRIAALAGGIAAVVLAVVLAGKLAPGGTEVKEDPENLLARNGSFELSLDGKPVQWSLRGQPRSSISVVPQGRTGAALLVEKAAGPADAVVECAYAGDFALGKGAAVKAAAWARADGFGGIAAIKIDWLRAAGGALVAEEFSAPAQLTGAWSLVEERFSPPAGAGAFRLALAVAGRGGRVQFDDVSARLEEGAPAPADHRLGAFRVSASRAGALQIDARGRPLLANLHLRLESEGEGAVPQSLAREVIVSGEPGRVVLKGRMPAPGDLREIDLAGRLEPAEGGLKATWALSGPHLRLADRVTVLMALPGIDRVQGIPEAAEGTAMRVSFRTRDAEHFLEYGAAARVRAERSAGGVRLLSTFPVDGASGAAEITLTLREAGSGGVDPLEAASRARLKRELGKALEILREHVARVKEPAIRDRVERDIKQLEEEERREWTDILALAFQASISRRTEAVGAARQALDQYQQRWPGAAAAARADDLREEMTRVMAAASAENEGARPRRIFLRAKQCADQGKKAIAQEMLRTLLARYPGSDVTAEAQQLLKTVAEP